VALRLYSPGRDFLGTAARDATVAGRSLTPRNQKQKKVAACQMEL